MIEEVKDDPSPLQSVARVMGAINLHNMFVQVSDRDATFQQRAEFQKVVNKIGRLEPTDAQVANGGFSLKIVLNGGQSVALHAAPLTLMDSQSEVIDVE